MIRYIKSLAVIGITLLATASCSNDAEKDKETSDADNAPTEIAEANLEAEAYLDYLDFNDSLAQASSLHYSREINGQQEWIEVTVTLDDSNNVLKMVEQFLVAGSNSVFSNHFYFKDGRKYATKQFFLETQADSAYFVELLSFYDKDDKVTATKRRTALYENDLVQAQYMVAPKKECKEDRAFDILNGEGKFQTTFQGFIDMEGFTYLVVGENAKDGFSTALVVQQNTPLIRELRKNESKMIGTPLRVNHQTITDASGSQQILMGVAREN